MAIMANARQQVLLVALLLIRQCACFDLNIGGAIPDYEAPPTASPTSRDQVPYQSLDIASTKATRGIAGESTDCYKVLRNLHFNDAASNPGCWTDRYELEYYNGYLDEHYEETGYPQEIYQEVRIETISRCQSGEPDSCTIRVQGKGQCNRCSYDGETKKVTMLDCSNLEGVFPPGKQAMAPMASSSSGGDKIFFQKQVKLFFGLKSDNGERCDHPTWSGKTYAPTPAPEGELHVKLKLTYDFFQGKGKEPSEKDMASLLLLTKNFIQHTLNGDAVFGAAGYVDEVELELQKDTYTTDQLITELYVRIHLDEAKGPSRSLTGTRINRILSQASTLNKYLFDYVRHLGRIQRSCWYFIQKVHFRGVA